VPPVAANATSTVAVFPGYLGAALGFRREVAAFDRARLIRIAAAAAAGGLIGSLLLLVSSNAAFSAIVPFLLLGATAAFAVGDRLRARLEARRRAKGLDEAEPGLLGMFLVSLYGGYFNGGLGIVLLALFALWGMTALDLMNGLKSALSFLLSAVSVATFAAAGIVAWPEAATMMVAATLGGWLGAPLARALPRSVVRGVVIAVGLATSAVFFAQLG
jgi:uncharacterized protein